MRENLFDKGCFSAALTKKKQYRKKRHKHREDRKGLRAGEDEDKQETRPGIFLKERNLLADKSFLHAYKCISACPSLPPPPLPPAPLPYGSHSQTGPANRQC